MAKKRHGREETRMTNGMKRENGIGNTEGQE